MYALVKKQAGSDRGRAASRVSKTAIVQQLEQERLHLGLGASRYVDLYARSASLRRAASSCTGGVCTQHSSSAHGRHHHPPMHGRWRVQCLLAGKEVDQSKGLRDELAAAAVRKANKQQAQAAMAAEAAGVAAAADGLVHMAVG